MPSKADSLVRRIETERTRAKAERLYYVLVAVDNAAGSEAAELDSIEFVDGAGRRSTSVSAQDVIERWHQPSGYPARRRLIKLQTDMEVSLEPGQSGTVVKVFDRPIRSIAKSFVYLRGGLEVVEAKVT